MYDVNNVHTILKTPYVNSPIVRNTSLYFVKTIYSLFLLLSAWQQNTLLTFSSTLTFLKKIGYFFFLHWAFPFHMIITDTLSIITRWQNSWKQSIFSPYVGLRTEKCLIKRLLFSLNERKIGELVYGKIISF